MAKEVSEAAGISSDAVKAKTGKGWADWFAVLDRAGAAEWPHKEIARHLYDKCGCTGWWSQMVTVGYEQERGLRVKHQKCDGEFAVNATKTIGVPVATLFGAWDDAKTRAKWLPDAAKIIIRKATKHKSLRITWADGTTNVDVNFVVKGPAKSQVAVEHRRLAGPKDVARRKEFWVAALSKLQTILDGTAVNRKPKAVARPARPSTSSKRRTP